MDFFFIKWYWTHIYNQLRNAYSIYYTWTNLQFMLLFIECSKTWCVVFSPLIAFIYVICACLRLVVSNTSWLCKLHGGCLITDSNCLPFANTCGHRRFLMGSVLLIVLVSCVVLCLCVLFVFFLCLECSKWPVSLDCPFLVATFGFH